MYLKGGHLESLLSLQDFYVNILQGSTVCKLFDD